MRVKPWRRLAALVAFVALVGAAQASTVIGMQSRALPAAPKRVVVLEYMLAEAMAALDITPVGMVDPHFYPLWIGYDTPRFARTVYVGSRQQPNLEAIARLEPDLIVGVTFRHAPLFDAFARIAPTVLVEFNSPRPADNQLDHALAVFEALAAVTHREARARAVRRELDAALERNRARIARAGLSGRQLVVLQELGLQDRYWAYTPNSMAGGIARRLGLSSWPSRPGKEGTATVSSRDLLALASANVVLVSTTGPEVSLSTKLSSPVWRHVPARRAGRVAMMERNIWGFGGPKSAIAYADAITDALLSMPRAPR
ncbi:iron complex transport system substrate-binding protein [Crenobacter luteus]|uniref:ABC transporter substrate-binding protein n=1 Tax=Crenobacter luteus TaxID=1452487 RepID=UPI0010DCB90D|nr:iron-siderophore ABC transporter substrate-binding protein [Crenobacter luteus]TCP11133.1 iron complex transport system substrate-binding protein [Crenobacter luteus]